MRETDDCLRSNEFEIHAASFDSGESVPRSDVERPRRGSRPGDEAVEKEDDGEEGSGESLFSKFKRNIDFQSRKYSASSFMFFSPMQSKVITD
jgi:hypothetical protein